VDRQLAGRSARQATRQAGQFFFFLSLEDELLERARTAPAAGPGSAGAARRAPSDWQKYDGLFLSPRSAVSNDAIAASASI